MSARSATSTRSARSTRPLASPAPRRAALAGLAGLLAAGALRPVPLGAQDTAARARGGAARAATAARFTVTSPDVAPGARLGERHVFQGFGCSGGNVSPALAWRHAPPGTRSFAVTVHDPDAPTGSGWWHWVVWDIPATVTGLPAGAGDPKGSTAPAGSVQGNTDFGMPGYGGPCPPVGDRPHRYVFTVHALKVEKLDVPATATAAFVGFNLHAHALGRASFTARYGR